MVIVLFLVKPASLRFASFFCILSFLGKGAETHDVKIFPVCSEEIPQFL